MNYGKLFTRKLSLLLAFCFVVVSVISITLLTLLKQVISDDFILGSFVMVIGMSAVIGLTVFFVTKAVYKPMKMLSDAIIYAGHSSRGGSAPNTESLKIGKQMITSLALQVYDLASMSGHGADIVSEKQSQQQAETPNQPLATNPAGNSVLERVGLPIFGLDGNQNITAVNRTGCEYIGKKSEDIIGKPFYDAVALSFQGEETFEQWLKTVQQTKVTAVRMWERTRITGADGSAVKQFDLVASFSKDSQSGTETMLTIYDRTEQYSRDDQEINFVALTVHELRTPLTVMRGYIEVFEDEVGPSLTPELQDFMNKMQASAQQLTAFVGNILNVARVEENQLVLKLQENSWPEIVSKAVEDLELRARVYGKHIEVHMADNLPTVAVDRISAHEVINNLVDNAIKYSGQTEKIIITCTLNTDGMIETSVQDFGIGIPSAVMPDLFQKFYRSHKSKVQVSGSGLGLYLCKALVNAHGGNIWVRSKEGQGSIFSFTLQPFDQVKHETTEGQDGIMRGAHGWIKNHSMNRQ